jgi:hypothetical protein
MREFEIFSGSIFGEAQRLQIQLFEPGGFILISPKGDF